MVSQYWHNPEPTSAMSTILVNPKQKTHMNSIGSKWMDPKDTENLPFSSQRQFKLYRLWQPQDDLKSMLPLCLPMSSSFLFPRTLGPGQSSKFTDVEKQTIHMSITISKGVYTLRDVRNKLAFFPPSFPSSILLSHLLSLPPSLLPSISFSLYFLSFAIVSVCSPDCLQWSSTSWELGFQKCTTEKGHVPRWTFSTGDRHYKCLFPYVSASHQARAKGVLP